MCIVKQHLRVLLRHIVVLAFILGTSICSQVVVAASNSTMESLRAIVPPTNDIEFGDKLAGQQVMVPESISERVKEIVNAEYSQYKKLCRGVDCKIEKTAFLGPIFKLKTPIKSDLYVIATENPLGFVNSYYFFLVGSSGKLSKHTEAIEGRWLDQFESCGGEIIQSKCFSFQDITGNGVLELVVSNIVHNGTEYNAVINHYYHVGADLSLVQILAVERRNLIPVPLKGYEKPALDRILGSDGSGKLMVKVELMDAANTRESKVVGQFLLSQRSPSSPYRLVNSTVDLSKYADQIVTGADEQAMAPYNIDGFILSHE